MSYLLDYIVIIAVVSINKWEYLTITLREVAICTSPIMHLVSPPAKKKYSIVFNFSRDHCNTQEKLKTRVMQNFRRQISCIMGDI